MIDSLEAQKVISQHRKDAIIIATFSAMGEWPQVSTNPDLDWLMAGCMGKISSFALGLALAQPAKKIIVLDGDGSLLMNLGTLATIANMAPPNLIHFVLENGVYRTTGGQPIPNAGKINFMGLAKSAGYSNAYEFDDIRDFENKVETILNQTGPVFVCLKCPPLTERAPILFSSARETIRQRVRAAIQRSPH
ncbi:thiamine pyrophosphate-dependent enzyme [Chloroflexota bacterium]